MSKQKKKLKTLSGGDVVHIFERFGFSVVRQRGSHIKLQRILPDGTKQGLGLPNHKTIAKGTLTAIYNQAARYISPAELDKYFRPHQ
ncbi:MAG: type II toxin-antitoxin system HicA family toxin [Patescibacteria group bacterium]